MEERARLRADLEGTRRERDELAAAAKVASQTREEMEAASMAMRQELEELRASEATTNERCRELAAELASEHGKVEGFRDFAASAAAARSDAEAATQLVRVDVEALRKQVETFSQEADKLHPEIAFMRAALEKAEFESSENSRLADEARSSAAEALASSTDDLLRVAALQAEVKEMREACDNAKKQAAELSNVKSEMSRSQDGQQTAVTQTRLAEQRLDVFKKEAEKCAASQVQEIDRLVELKKVADQNAAAMLQRAEDAESNGVALKQRAEDAERCFEDSECRASALEVRLDEASCEVLKAQSTAVAAEEAESRALAAESQKAALNAKVAELQDQSTMSAAKLRQADLTLATLERRAASAEVDVAESRRQGVDLEAKLTALQDELIALRSQRNAMQQELAKAFDESSIMADACAAAERKVSDTMAECRHHETAAAKARAELSERVMELEAHRLGNHDQGREVQQLQTQLAKQAAEIEKLQLSIVLRPDAAEMLDKFSYTAALVPGLCGPPRPPQNSSSKAPTAARTSAPRIPEPAPRKPGGQPSGKRPSPRTASPRDVGVAYGAPSRPSSAPKKRDRAPSKASTAAPSETEEL